MHWCLGMYGSAPTWTFYVTQKLATALIPGRPVVTAFVATSVADPAEAAGTLVVKTHAAPAAEELARLATAIIITIRDPRDAIASLMIHNKVPFDLALRATEATAVMCARFMTDKRAILLRFETEFFNDPATIEKIAATFDGQLADSDRSRIIAETRREAIDEFIANLDSYPTVKYDFDELTGQLDIYDEGSGWHKHHAGRTAAIGRWRRELSHSQVIVIERRLGAWMTRVGYPPETPPFPPYRMAIGETGSISGLMGG